MKWVSQLFDNKERTRGKHEVSPDLRIWYSETPLVWFGASFIQYIKSFDVPVTVAGPLIVILIASVVFKKSQYNICFPWKAESPETEPPCTQTSYRHARVGGHCTHGPLLATVHSPQSSPEVVGKSSNTTKSTSVAQSEWWHIEFGIRRDVVLGHQQSS